MRVYINFDVLEKNGKDYLNYSNELNDFIKNINEHKNTIKKEWNSQNAEIYNTLMDNFVANLKVDANRMQKYGDIILGINDNFKETDLTYAKGNAIEQLEDGQYGTK